MCARPSTRTRSEAMTSKTPHCSDAEIDRALARAVLASFLAEVLAPSETGRRAVSLSADPEPLEAAAAVLDPVREGRLQRAVRAVTGAPPPAEDAAERLFGHTLRGAVCPYESEYGNRALIQQAHELADLAGFYEAFGLRVASARPERPDHVACELEFFGFLSRKEAWALEASDSEMLEITRLAAGKFLREHLGRFGRAFAVSLRTADAGGYYERVGELCEIFLAGECEHCGVPLGPSMMELRPAVQDEVPMACGSGEDLVQIGAPGAPRG